MCTLHGSETSCRFPWVLLNPETSCSFPWVSFNLGTRARLTLFSDTVYFSSFFLPDSAPSIINTRCYHTRLLGHPNGTACVIQCVVPCLLWHDSSSIIAIIIKLSYSVNSFMMVYSTPGHDSLVFSFTVLCLDTLDIGIISFWYLLCGWHLLPIDIHTLDISAHYVFSISIIIYMIFFDNFSIISLAIALFSYHNGPFKSIFFCLRRHIGRALFW